MTQVIETLDPAAVKRLVESKQAVLVDVREAGEHAQERIEGAVLHPLSSFDPARLAREVGTSVVFHCGIGKRSEIAAGHWLAAGHPKASHLGGGIMEWKAVGLPVISLGA